MKQWEEDLRDCWAIREIDSCDPLKCFAEKKRRNYPVWSLP